jgi:hypothetical protein
MSGIAGVHISLTVEEKKYVDEPYTSRPIVSPRESLVSFEH